MTPLPSPPTDPTPIFEFFRANLGTELLTAAVSEFGLFERLKDGPKAFDALAAELGLAERARPSANHRDEGHEPARPRRRGPHRTHAVRGATISCRGPTST